MNTPINNTTVRKRLGMTRSSSTKKTLRKKIFESPLISNNSPMFKNQNRLTIDNENLSSISNITHTPVASSRISNDETPTTSTSNSTSSSHKSSSATSSRPSLSFTKNKIPKKKLQFVNGTNSEQDQNSTPAKLTRSFSDDLFADEMLPVSDDDEEGICVSVSKQSIEEVEKEIRALEKELQSMKSYEDQKSELDNLIEQWKRAGRDGLEMLIIKTDPPQSMESILKCFNIPVEMFLNSSSSQPD